VNGRSCNFKRNGQSRTLRSLMGEADDDEARISKAACSRGRPARDRLERVLSADRIMRHRAVNSERENPPRPGSSNSAGLRADNCGLILGSGRKGGPQTARSVTKERDGEAIRKERKVLTCPALRKERCNISTAFERKHLNDDTVQKGGKTSELAYKKTFRRIGLLYLGLPYGRK